MERPLCCNLPGRCPLGAGEPSEAFELRVGFVKVGGAEGLRSRRGPGLQEISDSGRRRQRPYRGGRVSRTGDPRWARKQWEQL